MQIPAQKSGLIEEAADKVIEVEKEYMDGILTWGERYNKILDIWSNVSDAVANTLFSELGVGAGVPDPKALDRPVGSFNSIFMMSDSGARGSKAQIRQLAGMRGLMAKPSGEIIETPITTNFREGLTVLQYFISTHGARKGLADTALKTANSGYLTRRLVDVSQDMIITEHDCNTLDGIDVESLYAQDEAIESLKDRIVGRVALNDIVDPLTGELIVEANQLIDEELARRVDDSNLRSVKIRSVLTCESRFGVCALCYGRNLATRKLVEMGEAVGVIGAQSIGEPGTQLTMRTFHIGGVASSSAEQSTLEVPGDGTIHFRGIVSVKNAEDHAVVMNRNGSVRFRLDDGREKEYAVSYGATISADDGARVTQGDTVIKWDPFTNVILSEKSGQTRWSDIQLGTTMKEEVDEVSKKSIKVIAEGFGDDVHPAIIVIPEEADRQVYTYKLPDNVEVLVKRHKIVAPGDPLAVEVLPSEEGRRRKKPTGDNNTILCQHAGEVTHIKLKEGVITVEEILKYDMPYGAHIEGSEGDKVKAGDILAKIPRGSTRVKDITGGLPRVVELFEARKPAENALISEVDGLVKLPGYHKGSRRVVVEYKEGDVDKEREYLVPRGMHISVQEGDIVKAGTPLMEGSPNPHDILAVLGVTELQKYLVNEIQDVYRLQGVHINDKHIEVIVRQMLRLVKIIDPGDTIFMVDQQVDKFELEAENDRVAASGGREAVGESLLLGITKASLSTDSFISAASFQETTRILTEASTQGKIDLLRGLKENIVVGRLIPAGTGFRTYRRTQLLTRTPKPIPEPAEERGMIIDEEGEELVEGEVEGVEGAGEGTEIV
jgi:DNA-directed RNA polymerase subunit beta'